VPESHIPIFQNYLGVSVKNEFMANCPECGTELNEESSYCPSCGFDLPEENQVKPEENTSISSDMDLAGEFEEKDTESKFQSIKWGHLGKALLIGLLPAIGAYIGVSIAANNPMVIVLIVSIPTFGYLLYQRPTAKGMVGGASFWLAIEAFLTPLALLIYTFVFASQETVTTAGQAGAAIGGFIMVIVAFVVGIPVGIVFYLLSNRWDVSKE